MKWIVIEEDPKNDNYIAVILTEAWRKLKIQSRAHAVYSNSQDAMERARALRSKFNVSTILIFQQESVSGELTFCFKRFARIKAGEPNLNTEDR